MEDGATDHAELHKECGTAAGCQCKWCKAGACKTDDVWKSVYSIQSRVLCCSAQLEAHAKSAAEPGAAGNDDADVDDGGNGSNSDDGSDSSDHDDAAGENDALSSDSER